MATTVRSSPSAMHDAPNLHTWRVPSGGRPRLCALSQCCMHSQKWRQLSSNLKSTCRWQTTIYILVQHSVQPESPWEE